MRLLHRLAFMTCAIVIVGCSESPSNGNADSDDQLNRHTASQESADKSLDLSEYAASTQESTKTASESVGVNHSSNPIAIDTAVLTTSTKPSQSDSEDSSKQASSKTDDIEQRAPFNQHMTAAHRAIEQKHWDQASHRLREALQLKPNSTAARDLQEFVATQQELVRQQDLAKKFTTAIQAEQWSEANEIAKSMLTQNTATLEQIQRSNTLVNAEQLADQLLSNPSRLSRPSVQSEVSRLRILTENLDPGERVGEKLARLGELSHLWTTPVMVNLISDGNTAVIVRPGRSLGRFRSQTIELMPGEYVLIGRRDGFHEVRRSLRLDPNGEPKTIDIEAKERF